MEPYKVMMKNPADASISGNVFRLDGRTALITGAPGHLGSAMAEGLARAGAHVILNSRSAEKIDHLIETLRAQGLQVSGAVFDVRDSGAMDAQVSRIGKEHGRLDILVNNAYSGRPGTMEQSTPQDFESAYSVAVTAAFSMVQCCLPLMKATALDRVAGASIINIASMYGVVSPNPTIYGESGLNSPPYYGAAKAALIQMTRYMACHLASDRIRVNCISPGPFPATAFLESNPEFHQKLRALTPMGRTGMPSELIGPLLFLSSDASSYVTGVNLPVDGGWTSW
jgi:NAD(P)-dependent dehydrogenase (short-subunit alcohol dehydrogenase family)